MTHTYRLGKTLWTYARLELSGKALYTSVEVAGNMYAEDLLLMGAVADTPPQIEEIKELPEEWTNCNTQKLNEVIRAVNTLTQKESK